jgi:hypothetical protein
VRALSDGNQPLAMTCEHAYVERFEDGVVEVSLPPNFADLMNEPDRIAIVRDTVRGLFGDDWQLQIATAGSDEDDTPKSKTLAQERDEEIRRRHKVLEDALRNHDVVKEAQNLFDVDPDDVRVQVRLFDDSPE